MDINYCYNCGEKNVNKTNFCSNCGASLLENKNLNKESINKSIKKPTSNYNQFLLSAKKLLITYSRLSIKKIKNLNINISTKEDRIKLVNEIKAKVIDNKMLTGIIIIGMILLSFFILSPSPEAVANDFIEYSAYGERQKAISLMSEEGKDYMMGMTREEFESHPDYAPYEDVLRTRISRLTHNRARQNREMVAYELIAEEKYEGEMFLTYQTIFSNGDMETPWIHLVRERGRWRVFSFFENSNYF